MVAQFLTVSRDRLHLCIEDLTEAEARRVTAGALTPVVWQVGHVAWADALYVGRAGGTSAFPARYVELFRAGAAATGEYPPLHEVWDVFDRVHHEVLEAAHTRDYAVPLEHPAYRNVGEMLVYSSVHRGYHTGKITSLRALLGKPILFGPAAGSAAR